MTDQSIEDASRNSIIENAKAAGIITEYDGYLISNDFTSGMNAISRLSEFSRLQASRQSSQSEPVEDPLSFLKTHGAIDEEGFEYGLCKVKFDSAGKPTHVLWTDIETVIALKKRKGIV
jgi:hypothetical protein